MTEPGSAPRGRVLSGSVAIVGSVNVDRVVSMQAFPSPGETRMASQVRTHLGGKGLSQAIAAARFGSPCTLVAVIGDDANGRLASAALAAEGIDATHVRVSTQPTGQAFVWVDGSAENMIAVVPGANSELKDLTDSDLDAISGSSVVLTQFESGQEAAIAAIRAGRASGAIVVLNAAPALPTPDDVLSLVDLLIVNEVEVVQLHPAADFETAASALARRACAVLVTLGSRGGRLYRGDTDPVEFGVAAVAAVDTTGAGDVSCGVIAAALAQGETLHSAIGFAFAAGALAVQVEGNASAIPNREQVVQLAQLRETA